MIMEMRIMQVFLKKAIAKRDLCIRVNLGSFVEKNEEVCDIRVT